MKRLSFAVQITLLRIILTPIIVGFVLHQQWIYAAILFAFAVLTDLLDGFVARRFHQESRLGQLLDPIADKILIISLMYALFLAKADCSTYTIMCLFGWFFIAKEIILLTTAAALYVRYDHFFKPTFFSRFVSVSEMFIIFEILLAKAFFGICSGMMGCDLHASAWFFDFMYRFQIYITMFLSIVLLLQYAVYVAIFLRKK